MTESARRIIPFRHCALHVWTEDFVETVFSDGRKCPAAFTVSDETRLTASDCGYASIRQMHFEHEIAHTFLSQEMGLPWSSVLRRVALGEPWTFSQERSDEEAMVLAFQTYLNVSPWLDRLNDALTLGNDVYGLARVFTACYRGANGLQVNEEFRVESEGVR